MKKKLIAAILIGVGIVIAFPLFSMTYYTMVRTSTPDFCATCHEIKPAVVAWRSSTHVNNQQGVRSRLHGLPPARPTQNIRLFFRQDRSRRQRRRQALYHRRIRPPEKPRSRLCVPSTTRSVKNATATFWPCRTSAGPCSPTAPCCIPGRDTRKSAWIATTIWFHNEQVAVMYKQYREVPYQAKGLRKM